MLAACRSRTMRRIASASLQALVALALLAAAGGLRADLPKPGEAIEPKTVVKPGEARYAPARSPLASKRYRGPKSLELKRLQPKRRLAEQRALEPRASQVPPPPRPDLEAAPRRLEPLSLDRKVWKPADAARNAAAFRKAYEEALRLELAKRARQQAASRGGAAIPEAARERAEEAGAGAEVFRAARWKPPQAGD